MRLQRDPEDVLDKLRKLHLKLKCHLHWEVIKEQYYSLKLELITIDVKKLSLVNHGSITLRSDFHHCQESSVDFLYVYSKEEYTFHKNFGNRIRAKT